MKKGEVRDMKPLDRGEKIAYIKGTMAEVHCPSNIMLFRYYYDQYERGNAHLVQEKTEAEENVYTYYAIGR